MSNILVIDDDTDICMLLNRYLSKNGFQVTTTHTGKAALESIVNQVPDIVLCDFRLDDMNGGELLEKIKQINSEIPVIIMTGYSDVRTAVNIMKLGAFDYVTKPLLPEEILHTLNRALSETKAESPSEGSSAKETVAESETKKTKKYKSKYVFGRSPIFKTILEQIQLVAPTNFSIIIYGESGSGKESVANEIHNNSARAHKPFIAIDCGALSKELASSELFGHEKGSFTGAINQKIGSFELANGGTIFLDEIANLSYDIQMALLRVVQERKMRRVGGVKDIDLDVRIIVASNERLSESAKKGKFREDLYHRFNEFSIEVPPLRNRREDIMLFADVFLEKTNAELNKSVKGFSDEVVTIFNQYSWPGNLRELNNVVKRSTLLTASGLVQVSALPFEITHYEQLNFEPEIHTTPEVRNTSTNSEQIKKVLPLNDQGMKHASIDAEFELIVEALKKCNYNKSKAAQLLNIDRKTLYNKMKQYKEFNGEL
ncbi:MAG: sigma-54 dependent transcriptional regulator [Bacteroidota bacterium]